MSTRQMRKRRLASRSRNAEANRRERPFELFMLEWIKELETIRSALGEDIWNVWSFDQELG
jgi:hypothetical protein